MKHFLIPVLLSATLCACATGTNVANSDEPPAVSQGPDDLTGPSPGVGIGVGIGRWGGRSGGGIGIGYGW